ncbi:MAG: threonine synthase [Acidimicrobiia bacterium]|nr:threonine synthase [Acidimicrobiia bacterium]
MRYLSTRGGMAPIDFADALVEGLAPDGGLVVPEEIPVFTGDELAGIAGAAYPEVAAVVLNRFVGHGVVGLDPAAIAEVAGAAYGPDRFDHADVVSLRPLDDGLVLCGLSHGPTLAFKDMAMQLVAGLLELVLGARGERMTVLGATSGDTGSSAEHALAGSAAVEVFMLSPLGRVTPFQAAQMFTITEPNIHNLVVRGVFDQCQDLVKQVTGDTAFKARHRIGAVNSINWGRVAAQAAYYLYASLRVASPGGVVSFAVPTGNFGNVYAGYIARRMGAPIHRLVVACNENDVLDEFLSTGRYRVRHPEEVVTTSSPSMDIAKASNLERFVYDLTGGDTGLVTDLFTGGSGFDLSSQSGWDAMAGARMVSGSSRHADRLATIRTVWQRCGVMVDPHTADGITVGRRFVENGVPMICLETAQPAKFAATIVEALGEAPPVPARWAGLLGLPQRYEVIDPTPQAVRDAISEASWTRSGGGRAG